MASSSARNLISQSQVEEQTVIFTKITRTVVSKVKLTATVKDLKALLRENGAVLDNIHGLSYAGVLLEDDETLSSYGIHSNSTLCLEDGMKLFVEIPSKRRAVVVEAALDDTVRSIRSMIQTSEGIHSDEFTLLYDGILLDDDSTMSSLDIHNQSTLYLVFCQRDVLTVFVKSCNSVVKLQVKVTAIVGDIKAISAQMLGVSADFLNYEGRRLKDCRNLAYYNIKNESVLLLIRSNFQIFVRIRCGNTVVLDVCGSSTIDDIKKMLFKKTRIPIYRQGIYYAGRRLEKDSLESHGICDECNLNMVILFCLSSEPASKATEC